MADLRPNLKICIDNTVEESDVETSSDSESSSSSQEGDSSSSDSESEVSSRESADDNSDNGSDVSNKKPETEIILRVEAPSEKPQLVKKYENKAGNFVTGFDPLSEEFRAKKKERAKRFGLEAESKNVPDLKILYESLGISDSVLNEDSSRGIRLNAVHLRGVEEMSTKDVFTYFKEFAAGNIEWIDDSSCNVVWEEEVTAARAMIAKSCSRCQAERRHRQQFGDSALPDSKAEVAMETDSAGTEAKNEVSPTKEDKEENAMDDDNDELDLMSSDEEDKTASVTKATNQQTDTGKAEDTTTTTTSSSSSSSDARQRIEYPATEAGPEDVDEKMEVFGVDKSQSPGKGDLAIAWPPGLWRLGEAHLKAKCIFMRFATKADKKLQGAESRSNYYRKYGNPNWGGMRGVISRSRKQRLRKERGARLSREAESAVFKAQVAANDVDWDTLFDMHVKAANKDKTTQKPTTPAQSDDEDSDGMDDDGSDSENSLKQQVTLASRDDLRPELRARLGKALIDDEDVNLEEEELDRLLAPPPVKRSMRMYADDEEERKNSQQDRSGSTTTDVRSRITGRPTSQKTSRYLQSSHDDDDDDDDDDDEQQRVSGGDLRNRLNRKRRAEGSFSGKNLPKLSVRVGQGW